ncbi:PilT/PilU family type 4a pilus ATPase [Candidatus Berkiella cookevillensis]|uniref:PilT/PilU family type 4a pilus ATPase n=1 Tax=Candidatus Berkiella cookevillensis TaxID=437022 RepID=A0A0Q9YSB0_9GAMM|nr:PilT/PilU family type 4a pilus ATPase [Candidatus Berkiella cookevillensis]MCS5707508.1 PilT/PilU family type 4a pilus ATPase [Candidatus Berkiella cookevillensis]
MDLKALLIQMQQMEGSDLYLTTGAPPSVKAHGKLHPISNTVFEVGEVKKMAYQVMDAEQRQHFEMKPEMNLALSLKGIGRFRVNIFVQRSEVGMVIRRIHTEIPSLETLHLPPILKEIITEKRGLVLFVGATGSGKSTSMAALINHRNEQQAGHIITIEDPIEFVHTHKKSIINQREVGVDTDSYEDALKNTLRQAPDLILIGEIRSRETMEHAIAFSETGHLCISTLHANSANQALDRIINFFPEERKNQLLLDLSFNLKAIISQRLIPTKDGKRTIAVEILLGTPLILSLINRGEISQLKEVMEKSKNLGMQTFDQALEALYFEGKISLEEAIRNADSKNNLRLKIQLAEKGLENNQIAVPTASIHKPFSQDKDDKDQNGLSIVED